MAYNVESVFIIGAGAIGKALAVFLKLAGRKVVLVRGSVDEAGSQIERLRVEAAGDTLREASIEVATLNEFSTLNGLVVLATKSYGNQRLSDLLRDKIGDSPLVLLQNGLGVERPFLERGFPQVYRAILFVTSQCLSEDTVRFRPVAVSPIGVEKGEVTALSAIVRQLNTPDFGFKSEENIQPIIWQKAIVNCVFNSVCPLLEADNGLFHRNEAALELARRIIAECTAVARAKGIMIGPDEVEESLLRISRSSDGQLISTLQDIRSRRPVEIDTLNFEIVRIARSLGLDNRVRETGLLGELTGLKAKLVLEMPNQTTRL
ncbi:2-dehydropantoate 2-reductase [Cytophagaceae bacterium SJW1-29]|uniref:2-dehydropantoate 2-reductase n=2 Tax=Salmonirosea aquatica TaxID=2654236 RepID=A0A7C9BHT9_9BACT|nr:2-dehydropantoate 2-reductase [Cytophagaceae bacterium SJW1-29]